MAGQGPRMCSSNIFPGDAMLLLRDNALRTTNLSCEASGNDGQHSSDLYSALSLTSRVLDALPYSLLPTTLSILSSPVSN